MQIEEEISKSGNLWIENHLGIKIVHQYTSCCHAKFIVFIQVFPNSLKFIFHSNRILNKVDISNVCLIFLLNWSVINGTAYQIARPIKTNQMLIASFHWTTMRNRLVWQRWRTIGARTIEQNVTYINVPGWFDAFMSQIKWRHLKQYESFEWLWKWTLTFPTHTYTLCW